MSESISPWISSYLINLAEQYGGDMALMPRYVKKKKTQIVEFLTYDQDDVIWARISDKDYLCPVRFSYDAVQSYTSRSGSRLTQHKTAIIVISEFKPSFSRIPQGNGSMSQDGFLILNCHSFTVLGSLGEARYGNPQPLESNKDLLEWTRGLRQHGGGGNCLRDRKQETVKESTFDLSISRSLFPQPETAKLTQIAKKQANSNPMTARTRPATPKMDISTSYRYQDIWPITKKPSFKRPPDEVALILASMKVDPDSSSDVESKKSESFEPVEPPRKRRRVDSTSLPPTTPSSESRSRSATPLIDEWPASEKGDQDVNIISSLGISSSMLELQKKGMATDLFSPPRSGERKGKSSSSSTSPLLPPNASNTLETVPHPPLTESPSSHARRQVVRKVPRPPQPARHPQPLNDPIVLVPNSDISTSYSLSQSQSQSKSHHGSQNKATVSEPNPVPQQSTSTQSQSKAKVVSRLSSPDHDSEANYKPNNSEEIVAIHGVPDDAQIYVETGQVPQSPDHSPTEETTLATTVKTLNSQAPADTTNNPPSPSHDPVKVSPRVNATTTQPEQVELIIPASEGPHSDRRDNGIEEPQPPLRLHETSEPLQKGRKVNLQDQVNSKVLTPPNASIAIRDPSRVLLNEIDKRSREQGASTPQQAKSTRRNVENQEKPETKPAVNSVPTEVQHDADLWAAPSFLQRSISKGVRSKDQSEPSPAQIMNKNVPLLPLLAPQALQESRILNGQSIHPLPQLTKVQGDKTDSRPMVAKKRVLQHDPVDNNQNNKPTKLSKTSSETRFQRELISDPSSDNAKLYRAKKRKQTTDTTVVESTSKPSLTDKGVPSRRESHKEPRRLSQPLLSWEMLMNILRLTEQDRMEISLDAQKPLE